MSVTADLLQLELDSAKADFERAEAEARYKRLLLEQAKREGTILVPSSASPLSRSVPLVATANTSTPTPSSVAAGSRSPPSTAHAAAAPASPRLSPPMTPLLRPVTPRCDMLVDLSYSFRP